MIIQNIAIKQIATVACTLPARTIKKQPNNMGNAKLQMTATLNPRPTMEKPSKKLSKNAGKRQLSQIMPIKKRLKYKACRHDHGSISTLCWFLIVLLTLMI